MPHITEITAAVQQHIDDRANDERHAAEKLRQENIAKAYAAIVAIVGAVQDDMYDRFGIPDELYALYLADVCGSSGDWWGGTDYELVEECAAGRYPVAIEIACNIGSNFADISYTVGGTVKSVPGSDRTQDDITVSWQIEGANLGGNELPDDKTLLELLREEQ